MSSAASTTEDRLDKAAARIKAWRKGGPALFARQALCASPTDQQIEASTALVERKRISIRSGHGTGKSTFLAWAILWAMCCYFPLKVPATAPSGHQLSDVLWAELARWHRALQERFPALGNLFTWTSDKLVLNEAPQESFAVARTARKETPEALQGFHARTLLFVIDEASGIQDEVFEVAEGALSGEGSMVIMTANPTRLDGYFHRSHHADRAAWATLHWDAEASPLVSRDYIESMRRRYGEDSAIYKIRVRGDFAGNPDGLIDLASIQSAVDRDIKPYGPVRWGVDVARFGDDRSALAKRRGTVMMEPVKSWAKKDTMETAGIIKAEYDGTKDELKPEAILIDVIGLGAGVVDRCKELGLPVIGINVAESPSASDKYNKLRDELWFRAREWFASQAVHMVQDDDLMAELTMPTYRVLSTGKVQVQSKDELKRDGRISPDLADAFCLTFALGNPARSFNKPIRYRTIGIV